MASSNLLLLALLLISSTALLQICAARSVNVGGGSGWSLGPNYAGWANSAGPFQVGDTLIFNSGSRRGSKSAALPHNVLLMKDQAHYQRCDFSGAVLVSREGSQTRFTLSQKTPHYFACSIGNGMHCQAGMKFVVTPH